MKLQFESTQLQWMDANVRRLVAMTNQDRTPDGTQMNRTARKMQYKFAGAPRLVSLSLKERRLVATIAMVRLESAAPTSTDATVVKSIIRILFDAQSGAPNVT